MGGYEDPVVHAWSRGLPHNLYQMPVYRLRIHHHHSGYDDRTFGLLWQSEGVELSQVPYGLFHSRIQLMSCNIFDLRDSVLSSGVGQRIFSLRSKPYYL